MNNLQQKIVLHLSLIEGIGPATFKRIIQVYGVERLHELYTLSEYAVKNSFGFSDKEAQRLVRGLADHASLERECTLIKEHGIQLLTCIDDAYPALLKETYLPPLVLYVQGAGLDSARKCIAVIGSRKANSYAQRIVGGMIPTLVANEWTIVSGGAYGVDTMAHDATVRAKGNTIVVLGSGLLRAYPAENRGLFNAVIANGGAVISPFPLLASAQPGNFPARNRIISGMSLGCIVVQAAQKSGARITAMYALEQGREVFAVPGAIDDELSVGCNALLKEGATLVTNVQDVLDAFGEKSVMHESASTVNSSIQKTSSSLSAVSSVKADVQPVQKTIDPAQLKIPSIDWNSVSSSLDAQQLQKLFDLCAQPTSVDDISLHINEPLEDVQTALFDLQLEGLITQNFIGLWHAV